MCIELQFIRILYILYGALLFRKPQIYDHCRVTRYVAPTANIRLTHFLPNNADSSCPAKSFHPFNRIECITTVEKGPFLWLWPRAGPSRSRAIGILTQFSKISFFFWKCCHGSVSDYLTLQGHESRFYFIFLLLLEIQLLSL